MAYHWVSDKSNTTGATSGTGTVDPSEEPEFTTFSGVLVTESFMLCVVFCISLSFLLAIDFIGF